MTKCTRSRPLLSGFLLCAFAAMAQADEGNSGKAVKGELILRQHSAKANAVTTVVGRPSSQLTELQQRKQQSIKNLNKRAEDLVHAWKLRQVRQAIADIKAQEEKDALIKAAADAAAAREEALRNQLKAPPVPPVPEVLEPTSTAVPVQTAEVVQPKPDMVAADSAAAVADAPSQPQPVEPQATVLAPTPTPTPTPTPLTSEQAANMEASVEGPIDRMALASSLFATQSYKECLSILKAVDQKSITQENRDWCDFLAACCYRKLDDLPEAESRYRSLLGRTEVSWLANATRWWLDHLNEQQKLRSDLQQLNSNFTAWQGEIDAFRDAD